MNTPRIALGFLKRPGKLCSVLSFMLLIIVLSLPSVTALETQCKDNIDNDLDGKKDSLDNDCVGKSCSSTVGKIWVWSYLTGENQVLAPHAAADVKRRIGCCTSTDCAFPGVVPSPGGLCQILGRESGSLACGSGNDWDVCSAGTLNQMSDDQVLQCRLLPDKTFGWLKPEICSNGIDEDKDGKIDCADPECVGKAGNAAGNLCEATETNCKDGFNNDGDTTIDCADSDCAGSDGSTAAGTQTCQPGGESSCTDGFDNDADGFQDTTDPTCAESQPCTKDDNSAGIMVWSSTGSQSTPPSQAIRCCDAGQCVGTSQCRAADSLFGTGKYNCGSGGDWDGCDSGIAADNNKNPGDLSDGGKNICQTTGWMATGLCGNAMCATRDTCTAATNQNYWAVNRCYDTACPSVFTSVASGNGFICKAPNLAACLVFDDCQSGLCAGTPFICRPTTDSGCAAAHTQVPAKYFWYNNNCLDACPAGTEPSDNICVDLVCDATHPNLCTTQSTCTTVGNYWYGLSATTGNFCQSGGCPKDYADSGGRICKKANGQSCIAASNCVSNTCTGGTCQLAPTCSLSNPSLCLDQPACTAVNGYWVPSGMTGSSSIDNKCHTSCPTQLTDEQTPDHVCRKKLLVSCQGGSNSLCDSGLCQVQQSGPPKCWPTTQTDCTSTTVKTLYWNPTASQCVDSCPAGTVADDNRVCQLDTDDDGIRDGLELPECLGTPKRAKIFETGPFIGCLEGDINEDNKVDAGDITPFIIQYREQTGKTGVVSKADITGDEEVNGGDITPFIIRYRLFQELLK